MTVNRIARWGGSSWSALAGPSGTGVGPFGTVWALTVFDDGGGPALYVGGAFNGAGGVTVNSIGRWNGAAWSGLSGPGGTGISTGSIIALTVFDDGVGTGPALYAGGGFNTAGGVTANGIARWDGSSWSALAAPGGPGVDTGVATLAVYDDGRGAGPALYAGGGFNTAGGVEVNGIARWGSLCMTVPVIAAQPRSMLLPAGGGPATLSIIANGDGLTYQWWRDGVALSDSADISGSDSPQLSVFSQGPSMTGLYACVVTNANGVSLVSDEAVLATRPGCAGDINLDGVVDAGDLGILLGGFGNVCP